MSLRLADYDYELPPALIATRPLAARDGARMLVLERATGRIAHRAFRDFAEYLSSGSLVVLNNTRVLAARRFSDDGAIEFLFLEPAGENSWKCLVKPGRKMRIDARTELDGVGVKVERICDDGERIVTFARALDPLAHGTMPIPPYMERAADAADTERYQTAFATAPGAVAAPTAGLHFTGEFLARVPHTFVTLHVGAGTFRPVTAKDISEHRMHAERFSVSAEAAEAINRAQRTVAVGTTTVRVLESAVRDENGRLQAQESATDIFIYPPQRITKVDALLTNFHLPRSTLLMLVSALAGREQILRAYAEAVRERYRFLSYGDCMLIV